MVSTYFKWTLLLGHNSSLAGVGADWTGYNSKQNSGNAIENICMTRPVMSAQVFQTLNVRLLYPSLQ